MILWAICIDALVIPWSKQDPAVDDIARWLPHYLSCSATPQMTRWLDQNPEKAQSGDWQEAPPQRACEGDYAMAKYWTR